jgi:Ca2+-binding RTX toxin-like protein
MAHVTLYVPYDMSEFIITDNGYVDITTNYRIDVVYGIYRDIYRGSFSYNSLGYLTNGTINTYELYRNGSKIYEITDGSFSAIRVINYLDAYNHNALYNYVLGGNDIIDGSSGNDILLSYGGDDFLNGNGGEDHMYGGNGDDEYVVDHIGDVVIEYARAGADGVISLIDYTLPANVENLLLMDDAVVGEGNELKNILIGNDESNLLYGGDGDDILDGSGGIDELYGGSGDDIYLIDHEDDMVIESISGGNDTVTSAVDYTNSDNVENLILIEAAVYGAGNSLNNILIGNELNNFLDGKEGVDTLMAGIGDDTYIVDIIRTSKGALAFQDTVKELANQGTDTIQLRALSYLDYTNTPTVLMPANFENIDASMVHQDIKINLTGNNVSNILTGNAADNILTGGGGIDTMIGGNGNDTYIFDTHIWGDPNPTDIAVEEEDEGIDTIIVVFNNSLYGTIGFDLSNSRYDNIENVTIKGSGYFSVYGNELDNHLIGNASNNHLKGEDGNDILDGGAGIDVLEGGMGDDIYIADNILDQVIDIGGYDTIRLTSAAAANLVWGDIEAIEYIGTAGAMVKGNNGDNTVKGGIGADTIDGGLGADDIFGGKGNDTYIVDDAGDTVNENANEGTDTVKSSISFDLSLNGLNVENLTLTGSSSVDGFGNGLANILAGNNQNNVLEGRGGADTLSGGLGDDTYVVNIALVKNAYKLEDTIKELNNQGTDTLRLANNALNPLSVFTVTLASYLENLDASGTGSLKVNLSGNTADNHITGNDENNIIDGGAGSDSMIGGAGDDIYIFDRNTDTAYEQASEGEDTVHILYKNTLVSAVTIFMTDTAYDNIENIKILSTGLYNVTGNDLDNKITGNASANTLLGGFGNDWLDGGAGADRLEGGDGDDTYVIDTLLDVIMDTSGIDTVVVNLASGTYTLQSNMEWAKIVGTKHVNVTGNEAYNYIIGNSGNNIIDGRSGQDLMEGGGGNDTYYVDHIGDIVSENFNEGTDTIVSSMNFSLVSRGVNVENLTLIGPATHGTGNLLNNSITGNDLNNHLDGKDGADTLKGGLGNDIYDVDFVKVGSAFKMADTVIELASQGEDTIYLRDTAGLSMTKAVMLTVTQNVENFDTTATGSLLLNITGNALNNFIAGNNGVNTLNGGSGHDRLQGGLSADTLTGGAGGDRFYYISGSDSIAGSMDIIKDFGAGDKISFYGSAGLSYYGLYGASFVNTSVAISTIEADGSIDDKVVYFKVGANGYVYVKDADGNGGIDYGGTLIMLEKKSVALSAADFEFNAIFESETSPSMFIATDLKIVGSLNNASDEDTYNFSTIIPSIIELDFDLLTTFYASQPAYNVQILDKNGVEIGEWFLGSDRKISVPLSAPGDYSIVMDAVPNGKFSSDPYSFTIKENFANPVSVNSTNVSYAVSGQVDVYEISLEVGHAYNFEALSGGTFDPKIRIYDESGRQLMVNDDTAMRYTTQFNSEVDGNSVNSHAAFIAPMSGTYYISVESAYNPTNPIKYDVVEGYRNTLAYVDYKSTYSAEGAYTFNANELDVNTLMRAQLSGASYHEQPDFGQNMTIYYSFPTSLPAEFPAVGEAGNIYAHGFVQGSYRGFSVTQQVEVRKIIAYWEEVTGISFVETTDPNISQISFGWMKNINGSGGSSYSFDEVLDGPFYNVDENYYLLGKSNVILNSVAGNPQTTNIGTSSFWNLINHELGHALGFEHPETYTHFVNYQQNDVLPGGFDSDNFTVMSYLSDMGKTVTPSGLQLFDIAAIQYMYGSNTNYNAGSNIYEFNDPAKEYLTTIWDGGGEDTIDASGQILSSIIYLQAGTASTIGTVGKFTDVSTSDVLKAVIPGEFGDRSYNNVTIAFNVDIENAKGGVGDDTIMGNALANQLWGNDGSDVMKGGVGDDTLYGGAGADLLYGGDGADTFVFMADDLDSTIELIADFSEAQNDKIDISDLLYSFDPLSHAITDFVQITTSGSNSLLSVDIDGTGNGFVQIAIISGVTGLTDEAALVSSGNLIVT